MSKKKFTILGTGLVALDIIINGNPDTLPILTAGGSCGNVLTILSFLGYNTFPIARLASNEATHRLITDISRWGVKTDLVSATNDGSTPIIIQRMKYNEHGEVIHRFEFRDPENGKYLPSYKPVLAKAVEAITETVNKCNLFYFDRLSRGALELAKFYKQQGATVFYEPSSFKEDNAHLLRDCIGIVDIVKFSHERIPNFEIKFANGFAKVEIETLGSKGAKFRSNRGKVGKWHYLPPFKLNNIKDSAGAGDWCSAGIIGHLAELEDFDIDLMRIKDWADAINTGQSYAALSCNFTGARGLMYNIELNKLKILILKLKTEKKLDNNILKSLSKTGLMGSQKLSISELLIENN